jgi:hypothetical protein
MPPSVRAAIRRRIDRLAPECRWYSEAAAIVDVGISSRVVAAVIDQSVLVGADVVDEAIGAGLVEQAVTELRQWN